MIARLIATDNEPFLRLSSPTLQSLLKSSYPNVPKSREKIKSIFNEFAQKIKMEYVNEINEIRQNNGRFTLSFDEWSCKSKKYIGKKIN